MSLFFLLMTGFLLWWMIFYLILPIGVTIEDNPKVGHASSGPKQTYLKRKLVISTLLTVVMTCLLDLAVRYGYIDIWSLIL